MHTPIPAERSAKHYAFPLSLTGLQLDPRKAVQAHDSTVSVCEFPGVAPTGKRHCGTGRLGVAPESLT